MSGEDDTVPWESDQTYLKVTLKGGSGFEDCWVNIGAAKPGDLRRALVQFFGWTAEETDELTLAQLAFNATQEWHAMNNVGREFSGTRAASSGGARRRSNAREAFAAAEQSEPAAPPDPKQVLIAKLGEAPSIDALGDLYAEHVDMFQDADVLAAYKTRGKALQTEGK